MASGTLPSASSSDDESLKSPILKSALGNTFFLLAALPLPVETRPCIRALRSSCGSELRLAPARSAADVRPWITILEGARERGCCCAARRMEDGRSFEGDRWDPRRKRKSCK